MGLPERWGSRHERRGRQWAAVGGEMVPRPGTSTNRSGRTGPATGHGERLSGDGAPVRHRDGLPGGTVPGPWDLHDSAALETVLATALRADRPDPEGEQRALAAFRAAAHGAGAHRARARRRDDWRPREAHRL